MKQETYNLIVKAVTFGMPVLAKDIITDLNDTLKELEQLKKSEAVEEHKEEQ